MRQSKHRLRCPYCGARISILVDHSIAEQSYVEDCEVCCQPLELAVKVDDDDRVRLDARRGDE